MGEEVELDLGSVRRMAACGCTVAEIATICGCSERTINRRCREAIDQGRARLNMSVRRTQLRMMRRGSAAMAIWLGKQLLGQRDKQDLVTHEGVLRVVEQIEPDSGTPADSAGDGATDPTPA